MKIYVTPVSLATVGILFALWLVQPTSPVPGFAAPAPNQSEKFAYYHEFFGSRAYTDPQIKQNLQLGMMNGLMFTPPVEPGMMQLALTAGAGLILRLPGSSGPAGMPDAEIERQRLGLDAMAASD